MEPGWTTKICLEKLQRSFMERIPTIKVSFSRIAETSRISKSKYCFTDYLDIISELLSVFIKKKLCNIGEFSIEII